MMYSIFSLQRNSDYGYKQTKNGKLINNININPENININVHSNSFDKLNKIRNKIKDIENQNSFTHINSSIIYKDKKDSKNAIQLINKIASDRKYQSSNQDKQKKIHTQSQLSDKKRRKSHYYKFFNKSAIDKQHNFIGKNYTKQVQNLKFNSINPSFSTQKIQSEPKRNPKNVSQSDKIFSILNKNIDKVILKVPDAQINKNRNQLQLKEEQSICGFQQDSRRKLSQRYEVECLNQKVKNQGIKQIDQFQWCPLKFSSTQLFSQMNSPKKFRKGSKLSKFLKLRQNKQPLKIQNMNRNQEQKYHRDQQISKIKLSRKYSCLTSPQKTLNLTVSNQKRKYLKKSSFQINLKRKRQINDKQSSIEEQLILITCKKKQSLPLKTSQRQKQIDFLMADQIDPWQNNQLEFPEV